jgi:DNA invertase Pin-like site-specific DNA recombinase
MNSKITADHLQRGAVVYVRQSTLGQVVEHTESQRRQYALADTARTLGFTAVHVIDDDLGRSASGLVERPGFQRLVADVCSGGVGAVFCIEASRLARNGRDWHHLIDLCALVGTLVIDADGVYEPRLINDRLLLGLKGTMSEYELTLLRQRGLAARDAKARRGELRVGLPAGYVWGELGHIELDPDARVVEAVRLIFRKCKELGSVRQVFLWARQEGIEVPVMQPGPRGMEVQWRAPAYHNILCIIRHPIYAGAYVFGRTANRTRVVAGRAVKTTGHRVPIERWQVLLHDHHASYISWAEFEQYQTMIAENAHMQKRAARKAGRGGRALLTGLLRCGRCGHMLHVFYGMNSGHAHRYLCRGDASRTGTKGCLGIGGVRLDQRVATQLLAALEPRAVDAAVAAAEQMTRRQQDVCGMLQREVEDAEYTARLAERRYAAVDPDKRLVARELEARWEHALAHVGVLKGKLAAAAATAAARPAVDRDALLALAQDLPAVWNAPRTDPRTKQRLVKILIREVVVDVDDPAQAVVATIHWAGGQHTELRLARIRTGRYPEGRAPSAVDALRRLGGHWPDRQLAVTLNRMRCKSASGESWTSVRVRTLRERLGIPEYDPSRAGDAMVTLDEAARRLSICIGSVYRLIRDGVLPATQLMPAAPWQIPAASLETPAVTIGVRAIQERRPRNLAQYEDERTLRLPGL